MAELWIESEPEVGEALRKLPVNGNGHGFLGAQRWSPRLSEEPPIGTEVLLVGQLVENHVGAGIWQTVAPDAWGVRRPRTASTCPVHP